MRNTFLTEFLIPYNYLNSFYWGKLLRWIGHSLRTLLSRRSTTFVMGALTLYCFNFQHYVTSEIALHKFHEKIFLVELCRHFMLTLVGPS